MESATTAAAQSASPPTSAASPSPPSASASRPSGIAAVTGFLSAVAALWALVPIWSDNAQPTWVRVSAMAMCGLVVLPPGISLALIGNVPGALAAWRGKGSP